MPARQRKTRRKPPKGWTPPPDWVRVIAWMSEADRSALKQRADEQGETVAGFLRLVARGEISGIMPWAGPAVGLPSETDPLFHQDQHGYAIARLARDSEWVKQEPCQAFALADGIPARLTTIRGQVVRVETVAAPEPRHYAAGIIESRFRDANEFTPDDRPVLAAAMNSVVLDWQDGEHDCVAIGPEFAANPHRLERASCVRRTANELRLPTVPLTPEDVVRLCGSHQDPLNERRPLLGIFIRGQSGRSAACRLAQIRGAAID